MADRTIILLTGRGLGLVEQALGIGRDLAPATFVFEDIDLVAAKSARPWPGGFSAKMATSADGAADASVSSCGAGAKTGN